MTKQIEDKVLYKGQKYILAGLKGAGLFTPLDFGISSEMMGIMTACYRRYFCTYECTDNQLFLVELVLVHHQDENVELPVIEGVDPKPVPPNSDFILFNCYQGLKILCSFSGGLILVRNPVEEVGLFEVGYYFPSPVNFEEVLEVNFENGQLRAEVDHSTTVSGLKMQIDEFRKTLKSENELAEVLRKWENKNLRVSDSEFKLVEEF